MKTRLKLAALAALTAATLALPAAAQDTPASTRCGPSTTALRSRSERAFADLCGHRSGSPTTRHLLAIGFDAKGLPISLFTVNSWVTGDLMLGADLTLELLASLTLDTGHPEVDAVIVSVAQLCAPELRELMWRRDEALRSHLAAGKLQDEALELLSFTPIDLDATLSGLLAA